MARRQITDRNSLGLLGMRERARLWGGYVTINSTPDVGTTVTIWIPRETASMGVSTGLTRVLVADDHATVREGIRRFLADTLTWWSLGKPARLLRSSRPWQPEPAMSILLDISLPGRDGLDILKELKQRYPTLPVLMFSVYAEEQYAIRALKTGAAGYITKNSEPEVLITALRKVAQGGRYISASLAERLAVEITTDTDKPLHATLANREYQVLLMLGGGQNYKGDCRRALAQCENHQHLPHTDFAQIAFETTADLIRMRSPSNCSASLPLARPPAEARRRTEPDF